MKEWHTFCRGHTVIFNLVWNETGQLFFIYFCGFDSALTNLAEVLQLVFKMVYDDKKDWNKETRTCRKESCQKLNLPCGKANLHAPRTCTVVQICLWQSLQEVSMVIFHLHRLDVSGRASQSKKTIKREACSKSIFKTNLF